jgi:hypothetical protein
MALVSVPMGARNYERKSIAVAMVERTFDTDNRVDYMLIEQYGRVYPVLLPTAEQVEFAAASKFYAIRR